MIFNKKNIISVITLSSGYCRYSSGFAIVHRDFVVVHRDL